MKYQLILGFFILFLMGCSQKNLEQNNYQDITSEELKEFMGSEDVFLVDTHIPEQEHIKGTDTFIPYDRVENYLGELPQDKNAKIVLYCRSGSMSRIASEKLVELGYTNVFNQLGGTNDWRQKGYEFE
ncbi:rhodanese-like domain-containing protein [Candidatus Woesearchaeota archaeon]|nr:rhodanese-like domain-containing protein [Candidatus Woesearchaeota archaeon]